MNTEATYTHIENLTDGLHSAGQTPIYWSRPGMGKTSMIKALVRRDETIDGISVGGFATVDMSAKTPEDLIGIPRITTVDTHRGARDATTATLPDWAVKALGSDPGKRFYLIWEEFTRADPATQAVIQETILSGTLPNGDQLPSTVRHIIAANPREEISGAGFDITDALASRITHLEFSPSLATWCNGMRCGFPGESKGAVSKMQRTYRRRIADYLEANPKDAYEDTSVDRTRGWATYRTWTRLADTLAAFHDNLKAQEAIITPTVGDRVAGRVWGYLTDGLDPLELVNAPSKVDKIRVGDLTKSVQRVAEWALDTEHDADGLRAIRVFNRAGKKHVDATYAGLSPYLEALLKRYTYSIFDGTEDPCFDMSVFGEKFDPKQLFEDVYEDAVLIECGGPIFSEGEELHYVDGLSFDDSGLLEA